jgi:hypothetical protein
MIRIRDRTSNFTIFSSQFDTFTIGKICNEKRDYFSRIVRILRDLIWMKV